MPNTSNTWYYEVYIRHPDPLEEGWDIRVGFIVGADSIKHCQKRLYQHWGQQLDRIIQLHRVAGEVDLRRDFTVLQVT